MEGNKMRALCLLALIVIVYGRNLHTQLRSEEEEDDHWEDAWRVKQGELEQLEESEIEEVENKIRADLAGTKEALGNLLAGGGSDEDTWKVLTAIRKALDLADLHEKEGASSIPPADFTVPKECTAESILDSKDCDEGLYKFGNCLKGGIELIEKDLDVEGKEVVEKVRFLKAVVHAVAEVTDAVGDEFEKCTGIDLDQLEKRRIKASIFGLNLKSKALDQLRQDKWRRMLAALDSRRIKK